MTGTAAQETVMDSLANADTAQFELFPKNKPGPFAEPLSSRVQVTFGALSHPGKVRPNNEDHFLIARIGRLMNTIASNLPPGEIPERLEEAGYVMVVADGMGGMAAGEVASRLAIRSGVELVLGDAKWGLHIDEDGARELMGKMVRHLRQVDAELTEQARGNEALKGMGTTVTTAYSVGADLFVLHAGDSRAYLFREQKLTQLTRDQTLAQDLADSGQLSAEEAAQHQFRHVLTSAVGGHAGQVHAVVDRFKLADGDRVLLCSDGLSDLVPDPRIAELLAQSPTPQEACQALVDAALEQGGRDNITVTLAHYHIPQESGASA
jgi:serine/threonine protein phosphatase PrpC